MDTWGLDFNKFSQFELHFIQEEEFYEYQTVKIFLKCCKSLFEAKSINCDRIEWVI